jgi:hypothetical protein
MDYKCWDEVTDEDIKPGARLYRKIGAITLIARIGMAEDYAVYIGWANYSLDDIAAYGKKVDSIWGAALFPNCSHLTYRI